MYHPHPQQQQFLGQNQWPVAKQSMEENFNNSYKQQQSNFSPMIHPVSSGITPMYSPPNPVASPPLTSPLPVEVTKYSSSPLITSAVSVEGMSVPLLVSAPVISSSGSLYNPLAPQQASFSSQQQQQQPSQQ